MLSATVKADDLPTSLRGRIQQSTSPGPAAAAPSRASVVQVEFLKRLRLEEIELKSGQ